MDETAWDDIHLNQLQFVGQIKERQMGRTCLVQGRMQKFCKILEKKLDGKRKLERPNHT
jgi:hypothetical protein